LKPLPPALPRNLTAILFCAVLALCLAASAESQGAALPPNGGTFGGPTPTGCTSHPGRVVSRGAAAKAKRQVAITFDDGPSTTQTPAIVETLDRFHAVATFFEEGRHVTGREELMREMLASGDEIGNHSFDHPHYPDYEELAATDREIRRATGFEPCLFRPPYGLLDDADESAALENHLETILWTFDSGDDHHPPPARIVAHVLHDTHADSIVLMHDGGHHPQTVRALPGVIEGLEDRGFELVTVSELLGGHLIYAR
jgi:peptidoglycan-N-acetylglucosamine deacetylase